MPPDVVQLVRTPDDDVGRHLITHADVATVVLTGAYETAQMFHDWKPQLRLIAETSGKNAMVVTGGADLDLAIKDIVRSAFGHAGQKCSAASLAILEAGLYDDARFLGRLADAVRSLRVGPAADLATMMGPIVKPAADKLLRALTTLDRGEAWIVEPRRLDGEGRLWSPGVKIGVRPASFFHRTECFGPVLGVMRARDLDEALALQNATEFGLTGGLHSLDPDEIGHWTAQVEVGNAYVNRHTTGAIVRRQPFGGWKHSAVGPGAKAGGPSDILRFVRCSPTAAVDRAAAHASHHRWYESTFGITRDDTGLRSEANDLRYRTLDRVVVLPGPTTTATELDELRDASTVSGTRMELVTPDNAIAAVRAVSGAIRLRALQPISDDLARACHAANVAIDDTPVTGNGRVELGRWLREQAISRTLHRHGRVPGRD
jgi:RHH-type proline utilization regulon transcriptional repressor/proline dehydrogenase/delta 1-pyrroline-5-carboxylate dehydrogenase